jgi:pyridoxal phosphate enzyme (YggS family)
MVNRENYNRIRSELDQRNVTLVAVSKTKPPADILELYSLGQRDFGENYVQELVTKASVLPPDTRWHFIGHLQTNKVKLIAPFVQLIQSVDSLKLLEEIDKHARKNDRKIDCLLQVHIAKEETKFGFDEKELDAIVGQLSTGREHVAIRGLMGMASLTADLSEVRQEFRNLKKLFDNHFSQATGILSMGMSGDYAVAIEEGSNMVRIGSLLFGERERL